jgi:hypothetical protein
LTQDKQLKPSFLLAQFIPAVEPAESSSWQTGKFVIRYLPLVSLFYSLSFTNRVTPVP